jgi:Ca-activated chloride channel homolog
MLRVLTLTLLLAAPARGCDIALVLATDVSGSVDAAEYQLQARGLAYALRDPDVTQALVDRRVALAVTQWSGAREQTVSQNWTRIEEPAQVEALAATLSRMPRAFAGSNTGVGAALRHAAALFAQVPDCKQRVIDISGDGDENDGFTLSFDRRAVIDQGIIINALAIEDRGLGQAVTNFFRSRVISRDGFVITARAHAEFAEAMRQKLLRELIPPILLGARPSDGLDRALP